MKQIPLIAALVLCAALPLFAQTPAASERVRVYLVPPIAAGGFVDAAAKQLQDSTADLRARLQKSKSLAVVESEADADLVVAVVQRGLAPTGSVIVEANTLPGIGTRIKTSESALPCVLAELRVGAYRTTLQAEGHFWAAAAALVGVQIEHWVKDNREQLRAKRAGE
jgi:hypothetical protein